MVSSAKWSSILLVTYWAVERCLVLVLSNGGQDGGEGVVEMDGPKLGRWKEGAFGTRYHYY